MASKPIDWRPVFLEALRTVPVLGHAAKVAGVDRVYVWQVRKDDKEFAAQVEAALADGVDNAEREAFQRAVIGYEEPLTHKGQVTYVIEHYNRDTGEVIEEDVYDRELMKNPSDRTFQIGWRYAKDAAGQRRMVTVRKHSDMLLSLVLKGRRKEVYADRTELTGANGAPVAVDQTTRAARASHLLAMAQQRKDNDFSEFA